MRAPEFPSVVLVRSRFPGAKNRPSTSCSNMLLGAWAQDGGWSLMEAMDSRQYVYSRLIIVQLSRLLFINEDGPAVRAILAGFDMLEVRSWCDLAKCIIVKCSSSMFSYYCGCCLWKRLLLLIS